MGKILKQIKYTPAKIHRGYSNKSLYINVGDLRVEEKEVTEFMKEKFVGGKGFDLWYLWHAVTPETRWDSPENEIVMSVGPLGGITQYSGTGKTLVCAISPLTGIPIDSNTGGYFGPLLKFSGWDALELQGKAEKDLIIFIDGNEGLISIEEGEEYPKTALCWRKASAHFAGSDETKCMSLWFLRKALPNISDGYANFHSSPPANSALQTGRPRWSGHHHAR